MLIANIYSLRTTTGTRYASVYEGARRTLGSYVREDRVFAWVL